MGDRTTVWVTCAKKDVPVVRGAFNFSMADPLNFNEDNGIVTTEFMEINYGGTDKLKELAMEWGITFTAYAGSGCSYCEALVVGHKKVHIEVAALEEKPICTIDDDGEPNPEVMDSIRRYLKQRAEAMKEFDAAR